MGAWACDPFGNDTAGDWVYGLEEVEDLSLVTGAIEGVLAAGTRYLEAPAAEEAIAAIDTIARLKGKFYMRSPYTEALDRWVAAHPLTPPAALIAKASAALERIQAEPSELLELWSESDDFEAWKKHLADLKIRIS